MRNRYCSYDRWDDNTYHPADQCYFASFFIHIFFLIWWNFSYIIYFYYNAFLYSSIISFKFVCLGFASTFGCTTASLPLLRSCLLLHLLLKVTVEFQGLHLTFDLINQHLWFEVFCRFFFLTDKVINLFISSVI